MITLKIIGIIVLSGICIVFLLMLMLVIFAALRHLWLLHDRKCPYCKHRMLYRGICERNGENHYMFQCSKCGAWHYLPVVNLIRKESE